MERAHPVLPQPLVDAVQDGLDLALALACGDDEVVGDERDGADIEQDNILALLVCDDVDYDVSQLAGFQCRTSW